jgi:hypothetical protein
MCYINSTLDLAMVSIVGDPVQDLRLELFAYADLAGDMSSKFSTYGCSSSASAIWFIDSAMLPLSS